LASDLPELLVVMRVYFEKPRTTTGWKGLINDPHLDGSGDVNSGLRMARELLLQVLDLGLPVGCEFLDPITPQYIADTVAWGAIGARTTESQTHRQLASGLSMPVGFKNRTDGNIGVAVDAVRAAAAQHSFAGVDLSGTSAILHTAGNADCHIILRGGSGASNYDAASIEGTLERLRAVGLPERVIIDASHDNSGKDHERQPAVAAEVGAQIAAGNGAIVGVSSLAARRALRGAARQELLHQRHETLDHLPALDLVCERGQVDRDGPALRPLGQPGGLIRGQMTTHSAGKLARLHLVEGQLAAADLEQVTVRAESPEGKVRTGPPSHRDLDVRGEMLEQLTQCVEAGPVDQSVDVIEDEQRRPFQAVQLGREARHGGGEQSIGWGCDRRHQRGVDGADPVDGDREVRDEDAGVVVQVVERQPAGAALLSCGPVGQQHRLAIPGRSGDRDGRGPGLRHEPTDEPRPVDHPRPWDRPMELGLRDAERRLEARPCPSGRATVTEVSPFAWSYRR